MMKRYLFILIIVVLFSSCGEKAEEPVIVIDDIKVSVDEFNEAYQASMFSKDGYN